MKHFIKTGINWVNVLLPGRNEVQGRERVELQDNEVQFLAPLRTWLENTHHATYMLTDSATAISRLRGVQSGLKKSVSRVQFAKKHLSVTDKIYQWMLIFLGKSLRKKRILSYSQSNVSQYMYQFQM